MKKKEKGLIKEGFRIEEDDEKKSKWVFEWNGNVNFVLRNGISVSFMVGKWW
ncbi:hypothetical protein HanXRQr2_Chr02g0070831 [Helianthus annuus]|uniref:Uncharacterized protein n=1 Tax=Helianthus annuus TaxID=4232 RepID=A0A9K3JPU9_HELAN|nr:hypothetical protein HanXRQr2_Chr02g0070831 [Helianthus annuus]